LITFHRALKAQPNAAHVALASLSIPNVLRRIAPQVESYNLITQNVDGLSVRAHRALIDHLTATSDAPEKAADDLPPADPTYVIEMHGRIHDVTCTVCDARVVNFDSPLCPALGEADKGLGDVTAAGSRPPDIPVDDLPKCTNCGALARPGVVWFGERPLYMTKIDELVASADMCLVIGTSSTVWLLDASLLPSSLTGISQVYPAAGYASEVKARGGLVAVLNLEKSRGDRDADFIFIGPCEAELPRVLGLAP
jgi:NAD+-dependent protein deacetylase sirtuin 5